MHVGAFVIKAGGVAHQVAQGDRLGKVAGLQNPGIR
jgi:hypothetical protein